MPYFYGIKSCLSSLTIPNIEILGVEPVPQDKLHITVLYIGAQRPSGQVLQVLDSKLSRVQPFRLIIEPEVDFFPSLAKPRALVLKVKGDLARLREVRSILISTLQEYKIKIEDRYIHEFTPHLTVGWVREKLDPISAQELLESAHDLFRNFKAEVIVDKIELIDSTAGLYRVLHTHYLAGSQ